MDETILTTSDNPYDPFTQWDQWYTYDRDKGYFTCELIDRFAKTSDSLSDEMNEERIQEAYQEIIRLSPNVLGFENVYYVLLHKNKEK